MSNTTTLFDMFQELQTWVYFDPDQLYKAKNKNINTRNSTAFKFLVQNWSDGFYDESPELMKQELEIFI